MTTTAAVGAVQTPVELVQRLYEAFMKGDIATVIAHVAPDCRWINPGQGAIPSAGVYEGPAGAAEFFRKMSASEEVTRFEPMEYFVNGDSVVARGIEEIRVPATGKTASTNWLMLFRVRGGMVTHFEGFYDTSAYARAHAG